MDSKKQTEIIAKSLTSLRCLRDSVTTVFTTLEEGVTNAQDSKEKEKVFLTNVRKQLMTVTEKYSLHMGVGEIIKVYSTAPSAIDKNVPLLSVASTKALGNLVHLSNEPIIDKAPIYSQILQTYRWSNKTQEYAGAARDALQAGITRRSHLSHRLSSQPKRPRIHPLCNSANPQYVDKIVQDLERTTPADITINITRPCGNPAFVEVTLGRVMRVVIILRSLVIVHVNAKAFDERFVNADNKADVWTRSKYTVFRKVTEHLQAAILHFHYPIGPEVAVRSYIQYILCFKTLFSEPCLKCHRYLDTISKLPPTWRDFFSCKVYHEDCKP